MEQLREDYQGVYESISACCRGEAMFTASASGSVSVSGSMSVPAASSRAEKDAHIHSVLRALTAKRKAQESNILEQMGAVCTEMMRIKANFAASKHTLSKYEVCWVVQFLVDPLFCLGWYTAE